MIIFHNGFQQCKHTQVDVFAYCLVKHQASPCRILHTTYLKPKSKEPTN